MFKTNSSGKRIISRRRARQVQKTEEVRAVDCISYEDCLMTAAKSDADEMPCSQCSRNMDTGGALRSDDPHLKYEVGACLRLLGELFGEKEVDYGFHF